ncbi:hypothetical protein FRB90_004513 [Tulasnella sp. 427]|nr:hypothetical protein FRB90_004513 [Tulasnella sp. 427]
MYLKAARTAELVMEGLVELENTERVEGFDADEYEVQRFTMTDNRGPHFSMAISCASEEAERKLFLHGNFRYAIGDESVAVCFQKDKSGGPFIILDLSNAPQSDGQLLEGCFKAFKDVILWSKAEKNKDKWVPVDFRYARITRGVTHTEVNQVGGKKKFGTKPPKETPTKEWRIAFIPDAKQVAERKWTAPKKAGLSRRGHTIVKIPSFCEDCISYSHVQRHCQWWDEASAVEKTSRPREFLAMDWTPVKSFREEARREQEETTKAEKEKGRKGKAKAEASGAPTKEATKAAVSEGEMAEETIEETGEETTAAGPSSRHPAE